MGTWRLKAGFNLPQFQGDWDTTTIPGYHSMNYADSTQNFGRFVFAMSATGLYLDGSPTITLLEDLDDDFGIDSIDWNTYSWPTAGRQLLSPFQVGAFSIGGSGLWGMDLGFGIYQSYYGTGVPVQNYTLNDPYTLPGYPPYFTKWNGILPAFIQQLTVSYWFQRNYADGGVNFNVFVTQDYTYLEITGTYDLYPIVSTSMVGEGGMAFGNAATIQALADASGIYTLVPNQFHDELYQRVGTASSTTVTVPIPSPFFKTGLIGGN